MGQWKGHDRHRDLPLLGIDPDAASDWEPVDSGVRPDNRDPSLFVYEEGGGILRGERPEIGLPAKTRPRVGQGRELMIYQRELATRLNSIGEQGDEDMAVQAVTEAVVR
jgi:hypothetical protein